MKKLFLLGIGSALIFTIGGVGPAEADGGSHISSAVAAGTLNAPITTTAGRCASCHRAHTAKAEKLLKQAQPQLCYSCHDGSVASTNVIDGNGGVPAKGLRGGGFKLAQIDAANATKTMGALDLVTGRIATSGQKIPVLATGVAVTSRHEIDGVTAGTAWGNGATDTASLLGKSLTLECGSCHDPHGNKNYRILRPIPVDSGYVSRELKAAVAFKAGTPDVWDMTVNPWKLITAAVPDTLAVPAVMSPATGIRIPDATAKDYETSNYWLSGDTNVPIDATATLTGTAKATDIAPDGYINNIANWCTTCHTRYLAGSGSYAKALVGTSTAVAGTQTTSPVAAGVDANFTYRHRSDANYKAGAANCITCHVSHGSNAAAGGGLNPGDTAVTTLVGATSSDSRLLRVANRGTCSMCHNV